MTTKEDGFDEEDEFVERERGCCCIWEHGDDCCPIHPTCWECGGSIGGWAGEENKCSCNLLELKCICDEIGDSICRLHLAKRLEKQ